MVRAFLILGFSVGLVALFSCTAKREAAPAATRPSIAPAVLKPIADSPLHNAHQVTDDVFSGAQPEDEESFEALAALGVKTIISVDGAKPDAATARKHGMRYVHLPIGYNGVTEEQGVAIAKALKELPGPFYVHCHHGKHRSAAAVAVACVYGGALRPEEAEAVLKTFGTGANYTGLWRDARDARRVDEATIRGREVRFVEAAPVPPMADAMVAIDRHWEHLKLLQKNGWERVASHPDLDPPHEALQLLEHFTETGRTPAAGGKPEEFRRMLSEGEAGSAALRDALAARPMDRARAEGAFKRVGQSCAACHKAYRD